MQIKTKLSTIISLPNARKFSGIGTQGKSVNFDEAVEYQNLFQKRNVLESFLKLLPMVLHLSSHVQA